LSVTRVADPVRYSIEIAAAPEVVFDYFTRPELMLTWMGESAVLDARPGGEFTMGIRGTLVRGEYLEVQRPRRIVFSWGHLGSPTLPPGVSRVEVRLDPVAAGTLVEIIHSGLPAEHVPPHERGWRRFGNQLASLFST
jgi:uncharacterized protein YndB with AHSA1/START domain